MFSRGVIAALTVVALSGLFIFDAYAQWSPSGMAVNFGDLKLAVSPGPSGSGTYVIGSTTTNSPNMNSSLTNNTSVNSSVVNNPKTVPVLDLSKYATGRLNNNLTGYTNIMYPFAESRGSTAGTAGGGSGSCGCG